MAVGSCLLGYLILYRWVDSPQPKSKGEASKETEQRPRPIDPDNAIERVEDD